MEIRKAVPDDAEAVSALILSLAERFLADPDDRAAAEPFFAAHGPEALRRTLSDDRFRYRVAEEGGRLIGAVGVRDGSHLLHLFVAEGHHRRGIATRLWALAKAEALAAGNPGRFTVNSSLGALPVYERFGFVATGPKVEKDGIAFVPMSLDEQ